MDAPQDKEEESLATILEDQFSLSTKVANSTSRILESIPLEIKEYDNKDQEGRMKIDSIPSTNHPTHLGGKGKDKDESRLRVDTIVKEVAKDSSQEESERSNNASITLKIGTTHDKARDDGIWKPLRVEPKNPYEIVMRIPHKGEERLQHTWKAEKMKCQGQTELNNKLRLGTCDEDHEESHTSTPYGMHYGRATTIFIGKQVCPLLPKPTAIAGCQVASNDNKGQHSIQHDSEPITVSNYGKPLIRGYMTKPQMSSKETKSYFYATNKISMLAMRNNSGKSMEQEAQIARRRKVVARHTQRLKEEEEKARMFRRLQEWDHQAHAFWPDFDGKSEWKCPPWQCTKDFPKSSQFKNFCCKSARRIQNGKNGMITSF